jgi:hypothetical protein
LAREEIRARLKQHGIFADASFSQELLRLPVQAFVKFLDGLVDPKTKRDLQRILVKDKQLPDKSFKGLTIGVLKKLGEKAAGKVGEEVAGAIAKGVGEVAKPAIEQLTRFLGGLLGGDAKGATTVPSGSSATSSDSPPG